VALYAACHAVENCLAVWFPEGVIGEFEWTARQCWVFKVSVPTFTFQLLVGTVFLDKTNDHDMERLLHKWHVAGRMRMTGAR